MAMNLRSGLKLRYNNRCSGLPEVASPFFRSLPVVGKLLNSTVYQHHLAALARVASGAGQYRD